MYNKFVVTNKRNIIYVHLFRSFLHLVLINRKVLMLNFIYLSIIRWRLLNTLYKNHLSECT